MSGRPRPTGFGRIADAVAVAEGEEDQEAMDLVPNRIDRQPSSQRGREPLSLAIGFLLGMACTVAIGSVGLLSTGATVHVDLNPVHSGAPPPSEEFAKSCAAACAPAAGLSLLGGVDELFDLARQQDPVPDKFYPHHYQTTYGLWFMPLRQKKLKMLEIGLGCYEGKHPRGAPIGIADGARFWHRLLPHAEIWEADINSQCVDKLKASHQVPERMHIVVGDQGSPATLKRWIQETGGHFDIVVDDGGHKNSQIKTSFEHLWPQVKPGGLYIMEDLEQGRTGNWEDTDGKAIMQEVVKDWVGQKIIARDRPRLGHELPKDVEAIFVQQGVALLLKAHRKWD